MTNKGLTSNPQVLRSSSTAHEVSRSMPLILNEPNLSVVVGEDGFGVGSFFSCSCCLSFLLVFCLCFFGLKVSLPIILMVCGIFLFLVYCFFPIRKYLVSIPCLSIKFVVPVSCSIWDWAFICWICFCLQFVYLEILWFLNKAISTLLLLLYWSHLHKDFIDNLYCQAQFQLAIALAIELS